MHFLIVTQYYPPEIGAPQTRLSSLAEVLKRRGHRVEVLTGMPNYPLGRIRSDYRGSLYRYEEIAGVPVHRVWLLAAMGSGIGRLLNYASFSAALPLGLLRVRRPSVVFVESPPLSVAVPGLLAARFWGATAILNIADLWPDSIRELGVITAGPMLSALGRLERWAYSRSDFVTTVSLGLRTAIISKGVPPQKVLFLPNGVDTKLFDVRPKNSSLLPDLGVHLAAEDKVIAYVGTMGLAQDLSNVLSSMALLRDRGVPVHLVLIGDGSERRALELQARQLRLRNVTFLPAMPLEAVAQLWAAMDIGIASLRGLSVLDVARPSKLFPMMASGKPILFCGRGEAASLIRGADAGLVVPPGDPGALADSIEELLKDQPAMLRMGLNGRAYVEDNLSWDHVIDDWLSQLAAKAIT